MEKNSAEELRFDYLCGKCFSHASRTGRPGKVLSCCDFLCYDCGNGIQEPFTCPSCRKQNVKFVATDDPSIPAEVARNISDPEQFIDQLKSVLLFQIKHYKTMLHRAVGKMMRDKKEFHRRLALMESGQHGDNQGRIQQPQIPSYEARSTSTIERDSIERPSKIARPSTSTGTFRTSSSPNLPSSSSSSGMWKTGRILPSDKDDNHQAIHRQVREQGIQERVVRRPVTANGLQQDNAVGLGRSADGLSLSSLLDGNNASVASRITADSQTSRYRSNEVQMLGQGQSLRPAFNTPSGIGQTPGFNPRTPRLPPTTSGQQKADRPLTPSTLFLPTSQQSQYFPRQQQQQQQQSRQQQIQQPQIRLGQVQGSNGQQGYQQRPSTTPAPLSRLRSPHSHVPISLPRTPNTLASGTIAVTLSQQHIQQQ